MEVDGEERVSANRSGFCLWDYEAEEEFEGKKIKFIPLRKWLVNSADIIIIF